MKNTLKYNKLMILLSGLLFSGLAFADPSTTPAYVTLTVIASTVSSTVANLATVLVDVSIIAGIGFAIAAFFKFHQHKQNPQQVQLTQGVSLLLIGAGLTLVPLLIPTASVSILGSQGADVAQVNGSAIHKLIGSGN